jgi:hypothetical protein
MKYIYIDFMNAEIKGNYIAALFYLDNNVCLLHHNFIGAN